MRGKLDFEPGQAASGLKLTIYGVLAEYPRAEKVCLAPKTHARCTDAIRLFAHSLNSYAANSLSPFERARFDKLFNREFCDILGPAYSPKCWRVSEPLHGQ
jgi:hypothetical protein